jgi:LmbE family N-acetylglucosaminyl deacetylase
MNILFVGAHPDDLEFVAGGTIARCVQRGDRVTIAVATNGNVGSPTLNRKEIADVRHKEARAAAETLGAADFIGLDEDDEMLFENERTRLKFVDAIRRAKADLIVTHNADDYHPDHIACSHLATNARIVSAVRLIETDHPPVAKIPELYHMDSAAGMNFHPQEYVDISDQMELKRKALAKHESQNAWIQAILGQDLPALMERQTSFRGLQAGVSYAEGFLRPIAFPRSPAKNLLP